MQKMTDGLVMLGLLALLGCLWLVSRRVGVVALLLPALALAQPAPSPNATRLRGYATASLPACAAGQAGMVAFDSTTGTLKKCNGSAWVATTSDVATVTGTLPVANGGTGASTLTANNVILGNGTSAVQFVAPGTSGNVLTSNGTTWASTAPAASGGSGTWPPPAPGSPSAYDDEFSASTLDAKWTASTGGSGWTIGSLNIFDTAYTTANAARYSLTQRSGFFVAQPSGDSNFSKVIAQSITYASTSGVLMCVQHAGRNDLGRIGLIITHNGSNYAQIAINWAAPGFGGISAATVTAETNDGGSGNNTIVSWSVTAPQPECVFIGRVSTSYTFWAGAGGHWYLVHQRTMTTLAPSGVSIEFWNGAPSTVLPIYGVDLFRYQTSATPPW